MSAKDEVRPQRLEAWWQDVLHARDEQPGGGRKTKRPQRLTRTVRETRRAA